MPRVFLGIGSNIDRYRHIDAALSMLTQALGTLHVSSVYESDAVGFSGNPFLNLVVGCTTSLHLSELIHLLKTVEDKNGRVRTGPKFSDRTLDIDVLIYGNCVGRHAGILLPRPEILEQAHVLRPLAEIAEDLHLPGSEHCCGALWQAYDKSRQPLHRVDFDWQGHSISRAES